MSTLTEKREEDARQRREFRKRSLRAIADALHDEEGFERILAIPDEEWEKAMMQDQGEESAA